MSPFLHLWERLSFYWQYANAFVQAATWDIRNRHEVLTRPTYLKPSLIVKIGRNPYNQVRFFTLTIRIMLNISRAAEIAKKKAKLP